MTSCAGGDEADNAPGGKGGKDGGKTDSSIGGSSGEDGSAASGGTGGSGGSVGDASDGSSGTGGADAGDGGCLETELCDGVDNTCDSEIDEGCACVDQQAQECYSGDVNLVGIGECQKGEQTCDVTGQWGPCVNEVLPIAETCDGLDNDCNGQTDENLGADTCGKGICQVTLDACEGGATQNCVPKPPNPQGETCDGTDDDCDGAVDEGCTCQNGQTQGCYTADPTTKDVGVCIGGTQTCVGGAWGACQGEVTPAAESCDAKDNDCDGQTDEGNPESGGSCTTGLDGVCSLGSMNCTGGALVCTQTVQSSPEQCDGIDNDCNGTTDENNPGGGGSCNSGQPGVCAAGTLFCQNANLVCEPNLTPITETCNGADDDCDNVVDDGTNPCGGACALTGDPGLACDGPDTDACQEGTWQCGGINAVVCTDTSPTNVESCNGVDDDCDGTTDEGNNACGGVCTLAHAPASPCDGPDADLCNEGTWSCSGSNDVVCTDTSSNTPEVCNDLDDDCDGETDEGTNACSGVCVLAHAPGSSCDGPDTDLCAEGTWGCDGPNDVSCDDSTGNAVEICNNVDDDCDGTTDEGTNACGGACTLDHAPGGACDGPDADECNEGTWQCDGKNDVACSDSTGNTLEVCNNVDDDCDGDVDEGTNACGGVCALAHTPGQSCDGPDTDQCAEGSWVCDGTNAVECNDTSGNSTETCNGNDDDCDGSTDEGNNACGGVCTLSSPPGTSCDGPDSDECKEGSWVCSGNNDVVCNDASGNTTEVCNNLDDDCDGEIDEGTNPCGGVCALAQTPGQACDGPDTDLCSEGTWVCNGTNAVSCNDTTGNAVETCNGNDDDCDGTTDEGANACGGVCTLSNTVGSACDGPDLDQCNEGTWQCNGTNAVACSDSSGTNAEVCNNVDDDCDGDTDEGSNPCGGVCSLAHTPGQSCDGADTDLCNEGSWVCNGTNAVSCNDTSGNNAETCNGADDDCDGTTDEGSNACGGACTLSQTIGTGCDGTDTDLCNEGVWQCNGANGVACSDATGNNGELCNGADDDCNPATTAPGGEGNADGDPALACNDCADNDPARYPGNAEICDGKDNDCNAGTTAPGGEGNADGDPALACNDCADNDPTRYPGATEICDGKDNNCNSLTDEAPVASMCPSPPHATSQCSGASGCTLQSCGANFYNVNGTYSDGCECAAVPTPATTGVSCGAAVNLGTLSDVLASSVTQAGNVPFVGREIWYRFDASDDDDTAGDEFHVDVRFLSNPGNTYRMDVYRGNCPGSGGALIGSNEASNTAWYTDFAQTSTGCTVSAPCGEGNCTATAVPGANTCHSDAAAYYVRIYATSSLITCSQYNLELSNGKY